MMIGARMENPHYSAREEFAGHVPELIQQGASFLGGGCGTNPAFIKAVCAAART
jgi:methionine synthase I (cobalamin-dependent)